MLTESIQKVTFDAITYGYHGIMMEKKGEKRFGMANSSCHGWVPSGLMYGWLVEMWGDPLTPNMFWNIVPYTKNDQMNYSSYMIKQRPKEGLVMIKAMPKGGLQHDRKRKHGQGEAK
eukprot:7720214-Heterocapsa_arctica.AAC.1